MRRNFYKVTTKKEAKKALTRIGRSREGDYNIDGVLFSIEIWNKDYAVIGATAVDENTGAADVLSKILGTVNYLKYEVLLDEPAM